MNLPALVLKSGHEDLGSDGGPHVPRPHSSPSVTDGRSGVRHLWASRSSRSSLEANCPWVIRIDGRVGLALRWLNGARAAAAALPGGRVPRAAVSCDCSSSKACETGLLHLLLHQAGFWAPK